MPPTVSAVSSTQRSIAARVSFPSCALQTSRLQKPQSASDMLRAKRQREASEEEEKAPRTRARIENKKPPLPTAAKARTRSNERKPAVPTVNSTRTRSTERKPAVPTVSSTRTRSTERKPLSRSRLLENQAADKRAAAKSSIPAPAPKPKRRLTPAELREKLTETRATLKELKAEIAERNEELETVEAEKQDALSRVDELEKELSAHAENDAEMKNKFADLQTTLDAKVRRIAQLDEEVASLNARETELQASVNAAVTVSIRRQLFALSTVYIDTLLSAVGDASARRAGRLPGDCQQH